MHLKTILHYFKCVNLYLTVQKIEKHNNCTVIKVHYKTLDGNHWFMVYAEIRKIYTTKNENKTLYNILFRFLCFKHVQ